MIIKSNRTKTDFRIKGFLLPTDAQENWFKNSIKRVQQTDTNKDLITYAATPPD